MPLSPSQAEEVASEAFEARSRDRKTLDRIDLYYKGEPDLVWLPLGAPRELQALAQMARVNIMSLVVSATVQQLMVDGYASDDPAGSELVWKDAWQANRMDRKQIGIHRAVGKYGVAYGTVMPGENDMPVLRPVSPRKMTALYGSDPDWPMFALEERDDGTWRLYDDTHTYDLRRGKRHVRSVQGGRKAITFEMIPGTAAPHEQAVTPVVRYIADEDLDDPVRSDVQPLFPLQDRLNLTSFHLLVAQHYGAHGRRVIISRMMKELEPKLVKNSANTMLTLNANPDEVSLEEFRQTSLDGFLESQDAVVRMMSTLSQTPVQELTGVVANLAAEALVESRESNHRKVRERQTVLGESHEQLLGQAGVLLGVGSDPLARVRWQPSMDLRAIQLVDMLAVVADKLGVPSAALLDHLPFSAADVEEMRAAMGSGSGEPERDLGAGTESADPGEEAPAQPEMANATA